MTVIVVESGEYEQRSVWLVAASRQAAVQAIKAEFGPPYRVRWDEPTDDELVGHFAAVTGYSTRHTAVFSFEEYELAEAVQPPDTPAETETRP